MSGLVIDDGHTNLPMICRNLTLLMDSDFLVSTSEANSVSESVSHTHGFSRVTRVQYSVVCRLYILAIIKVRKAFYSLLCTRTPLCSGPGTNRFGGGGKKGGLDLVFTPERLCKCYLKPCSGTNSHGVSRRPCCQDGAVVRGLAAPTPGCRGRQRRRIRSCSVRARRRGT